jgi:hypothetical protein
MAMTTTPTTHMGGSLLRLECWPHRPGGLDAHSQTLHQNQYSSKLLLASAQ